MAVMMVAGWFGGVAVGWSVFASNEGDIFQWSTTSRPVVGQQFF